MQGWTVIAIIIIQREIASAFCGRYGLQCFSKAFMLTGRYTRVHRRMILWLFLAAPFIELWFLIHVGSSIGALNAIALLVGAGMLGGALLRRQSFKTLMRVDERLQKGEVPAEEILEGFVLTSAAVLLIIPGFITDVLAIPLLIPLLRRWLIRRYLASRHFQQHYFHSASQQHNTTVIEGEWRRDDNNGNPHLR